MPVKPICAEHPIVNLGRGDRGGGRFDAGQSCAPRLLVRQRVERDLRGLVIVGGHLHHQPPAGRQRLEAAREDFTMFNEPLQRGVGENHRVLHARARQKICAVR